MHFEAGGFVVRPGSGSGWVVSYFSVGSVANLRTGLSLSHFGFSLVLRICPFTERDRDTRMPVRRSTTSCLLGHLRPASESLFLKINLAVGGYSIVKHFKNIYSTCAGTSRKYLDEPVPNVFRRWRYFCCPFVWKMLFWAGTSQYQCERASVARRTHQRNSEMSGNSACHPFT
jgi:hypothetical protein